MYRVVLDDTKKVTLRKKIEKTIKYLSSKYDEVYTEVVISSKETLIEFEPMKISQSNIVKLNEIYLLIKII